MHGQNDGWIISTLTEKLKKYIVLDFSSSPVKWAAFSHVHHLPWMHFMSQTERRTGPRFWKNWFKAALVALVSRVAANLCSVYWPALMVSLELEAKGAAAECLPAAWTILCMSYRNYSNLCKKCTEDLHSNFFWNDIKKNTVTLLVLKTLYLSLFLAENFMKLRKLIKDISSSD